MARATYKQLLEGFSFAGTFLYSQQADAEGIAAMLGLHGAFPLQTDEGPMWMPGNNYDEFMERLYSTWTVPDQSPVPQAHPQDSGVISFRGFLDRE